MAQQSLTSRHTMRMKKEANGLFMKKSEQAHKMLKKIMLLNELLLSLLFNMKCNLLIKLL